MTVATSVPHAAPSSDSDLDPTAAELASLARELCTAEGLDWATALAHAAADLDPLACFARNWDHTAGWQQLQHEWGFDTDDELPF